MKTRKGGGAAAGAGRIPGPERRPAPRGRSADGDAGRGGDAGERLHKGARTTKAVRREIQESGESERALARRYGITRRTVGRWRSRDSVDDAPMGPRNPRSTSLSPAEEAACVAFRRLALLPLDDCLRSLRGAIPHLTRSSLHRSLVRHGISRIPEGAGTGTGRGSAGERPIGLLHIGVVEFRTDEGALRLLAAVDRACGYIHAELHEKATGAAAARFLRGLIAAVPYRIRTVVTGGGGPFAGGGDGRSPAHPFGRVCRDNGVEHRLAGPSHPWTDEQAERMDRTIGEAVLERGRHGSLRRLGERLREFLDAHNFSVPLKALRGRTPHEEILGRRRSEPDAFGTRPSPRGAKPGRGGPPEGRGPGG